MTLNTPLYCKIEHAHGIIHYGQSAHSKDMTGVPKFRNGSRDPDHAHLGDS